MGSKAPPPTTHGLPRSKTAIYCGKCGSVSDRGMIQLCRSCSGFDIPDKRIKRKGDRMNICAIEKEIERRIESLKDAASRLNSDAPRRQSLIHRWEELDSLLQFIEASVETEARQMGRGE